MTDNVITIIYIAQVSIIYAEKNVYTWTNASGILFDEIKKFYPFLETKSSKIHD